MTLLSIVVPCFNASAYMRRAIDSLLAGGSLAEIIIVDDGSTDSTAAIADSYQRRFPEMIQVIHKANGGHGSAINAGIEHARGKYFKVVDADDWLDPYGYSELLKLLQRWEEVGKESDLIVSNFVYEKQGKHHKRAIRYTTEMPSGRSFSWNEVKCFRPWKYMLMHSMVYRTEILRESGLKLPEHSFYVDNLYAFIPLQYTKKLFYLDVDLYRYWIGREDQSVNEDVMIRRIEQQIGVNKAMFTALSTSMHELDSPQLTRYLLHYLEVITLVSATLCKLRNDRRLRHCGQEFFEWMEQTDPLLAQRIRHTLLGWASHRSVPTTRFVYQIAKAIVGFN